MPEFLRRIIDDAINATPRWIVSLSIFFIALMFIYSLVTGKIVYFFGHKVGIDDPTQTTSNQGLEINQPTNQLEWEQRKYVADAARAFAIENGEALRNIKSCFPGFTSDKYEESQKVITKEEAREIIRETKHTDLLLSIESFLNSLEGVSTAYQNGVADQDMFEDSFELLISRWYGRLEGFIEVYKERCKCEWTPFETIGKAWKNKSVIPLNEGSRSNLSEQMN